MSDYPGRNGAILSGLSVVPLSVSWTFPFLSLPGVAGGPGGVHWSLALLPLLVIGTRQLPTPRVPGLKVPLVGLGLWLLFALLLGQLGSEGGAVLSIAFYAQLVAPAGFLLIGLRLGGHPRAWETACASALRGLGVYQLLLLGMNYDLVAVGATHTIAAQFPQFLTYYPGVLALGLVISITQWPRLRVTATVYAFTLLFMAPAIWSRIGLVVIALSVVVSVLVVFRCRYIGLRPNVRAILLLAAVSGGCLIFYLFMSAALSGSLGERLVAKEGDVFQSGRGRLMLQALSKVTEEPILGDAGQALYDRADFGGTAGLGLRLFPSHSQLLDLGIRGGVPAMILGVILCAMLVWFAVGSYMAKAPEAAMLILPTVAVMLTASISDLYFSQALTATPGWLLIGLGLGSLFGSADMSEDAFAYGRGGRA